jgi:hypothetical protein
LHELKYIYLGGNKLAQSMTELKQLLNSEIKIDI